MRTMDIAHCVNHQCTLRSLCRSGQPTQNKWATNFRASQEPDGSCEYFAPLDMGRKDA
jgi:hypothetical protein